MFDIQFIDLGLMDYETAEKIQNEAFEEAIQNSLNQNENTLKAFIVEHHPVYTLGKNGNMNHVLPLAKQSGAQIYKIGRGGDITYHGPGQIVIYPIFDLKKLNIGLAKYVSTLEKIGIEICKKYGINADISPKENGVWLDIDKPTVRKIMAIGIKASRFITMHGLAFNVNTELRYFNYIVPCGIPDKGVTSLEKELGRNIPMEEVKFAFQELFTAYFLNNEDEQNIQKPL